MVECDDGEFRGFGGYQGQCEPDPAPRQSEAQRLAPLNSLPIFIYYRAERHYVTVRMQLLRIYCDKHQNISPLLFH